MIYFILHLYLLFFLPKICIGIVPDWPLQAIPLVPSRIFDVTHYGAKADNTTNNTIAFTNALAAVNQAGGGTLLVPAKPGLIESIYLTLPLNLSASTRLRVERGVTLKALCDLKHWPKIPRLPSYASSGLWNAPFIGASYVSDIIIDGGGIIDSSGACFWGSNEKRGNLLLFERVQRAELHDVLFMNSPYWTLHIWDSNDIWLHDITVHNPASSDNPALFYGPNTDGIDIDSSRQVLVENSLIHAGDDCIVLKSGKDGYGRKFNTPTANILVRNVTLDACSCFKHGTGGLHGGLHWYDGCGALKIGTEMSGGIVNITFEDSKVVYSGTALKLLAPTPRGGYVRNVTWQRIQIDESGGLMWLQIGNSSTKPNENTNVSAIVVRNITMDKLKCRFSTPQHHQTDCQAVGAMDFDYHVPRITLRFEYVLVHAPNNATWECTGPAAKLVAPAISILPALPNTCALSDI